MRDTPERNSTANTDTTDETISMIDHPLVTKSQEKDVSAVSRFARAAREITSVQLAEWYRLELVAAPRRVEQDKLYFVGHDGIPETGDFTNRGEEHLAIALFNEYRPPNAGLPLPGGEPLAILDYQFPLKARQSDRGVGKIDLLGTFPSGRLCIIELKRISGPSPETPLRALLEGLADAAIVQANMLAIATEARASQRRIISHERSAVLVTAPQEYWEYYCNKPKARPWQPAMQELATRVEDTLGVPVLFLALGECAVSLGLQGKRPTLERPVTAHWAF